jgi:hypothetical protein
MKQMLKIIYIKNLKMKKTITLLLLFICAVGFAQNPEKRMERIKNLRIAYISNKLDLTTQEAEKFWPIFNKFDDRNVELQHQKRQLMLRMKLDKTDKETMKLIDESEMIETDMQVNRRQFVKDLQGVISPQKIILLKRIEEDFKNTLLKQFKERRKNLKE